MGICVHRYSNMGIAVASKLFALEDPLDYLPRKPIQEFGKRRVIYGQGQLCDRLFVVVLGRVKIITTAPDGFETLARIATVEDFFGESVLVGNQLPPESAIALDHVMVMSWTRAEIEDYIDRDPHLGLALSQYFVRQCSILQERIASIAVYKTPERVMLSLIQLAGTIGVPESGGFVRIGSLTQQTIAEFVGTSREIVTGQMNRLRRLGVLRYSRQSVDVNTQGIRELLRPQGISAPDSTAAENVPNRSSPLS